MNRSMVQDMKKGKQDKASFVNGGKIVQRKSIFGKYSDAEMLSQLRELALDPCKSGVERDSMRPLWNQILRVRKLMTLSSSDCPQRKRNLELFLKGKLGGASGLVSAQQKLAKLSEGQSSHTSSESCLLNSSNTKENFDQKPLLNSCSSQSLMTIEGSFLGKHESTGLSFADNESKWVQSIKDNSSLIDFDESVSGSNPLTPENPRFFEPPVTDDDGDPVHSMNSSKLEESIGRNFQPPQRSFRLLNSIGDHLQRMTIPIGPRFQADVPQWTGPSDSYKKQVNVEDAKWLGTRVWPIKDQNIEATERVVGRGRPTSCSCVLLGSTDCIKLHIHEESLSLKSDLGPAFLSWKFDEMGEVVSLSWTEKEQNTFEALMKKSSKNSLKRAPKSFPCKSKQNILSYYLNVYMLRCMSLKTRAFLRQIDSDDEKLDESDNDKKGQPNAPKHFRAARLRGRFSPQGCNVGKPDNDKCSKNSFGGSKDVRARYMLRRC